MEDITLKFNNLEDFMNSVIELRDEKALGKIDTQIEIIKKESDIIFSAYKEIYKCMKNISLRNMEKLEEKMSSLSKYMDTNSNELNNLMNNKETN